DVRGRGGRVGHARREAVPGNPRPAYLRRGHRSPETDHCTRAAQRLTAAIHRIAKGISMERSAHVDTFARDHLPPAEEWPEFLLDSPDVAYPARVNCAVELVDAMVGRGFGSRPARSEEHTSELQSRENLVCRLLIAK